GGPGNPVNNSSSLHGSIPREGILRPIQNPSRTTQGSGDAPSDGTPPSSPAVGQEPASRTLMSSESGNSTRTDSPKPGGSVSPVGSPFGSTPLGSWLDVTVVCRSDEVVIHPGGYRITRTKLDSSPLLTDRLRSISTTARPDANGGMPQPRLRFVVQPG